MKKQIFAVSVLVAIAAHTAGAQTAGTPGNSSGATAAGSSSGGIGSPASTGSPTGLPAAAPLPGLAPPAVPSLTSPTVPVTPSSLTPGGAMSAGTTGAPNTTNLFDMGVQAPAPPLMGTITQEVAFTIDKSPIKRGPYEGVAVHLHNGTNTPLMFDGDRAQIRVGSGVIAAVSDAQLETVTAPTPTHRREAKIAVENAVTVGAVATIEDEKLERGPILPRYGLDQLRREATSERFGLRILWPGDDTQGIVYFCTDKPLSGGSVELPVVTFPTMEIQGYLNAKR